jgi:hypothetical protein
VSKLRDQLRLILNRSLRGAVKQIQSEAARADYSPMIKEIKSLISKGVSPVAGIGRFVRYSKSYRDAIKAGHKSLEEKKNQTSPVNMKLTGEMLNSLDTVQRSGKVFIEFGDDKAAFHNNSGAGKSRVIRRLLPDAEGERFNASLEAKFTQIIRRIVKKLKFR